MGSLDQKEEHLDTLHVEVTNRCNFECIMCIRRNWDAKLVDLDIDLYRKIAKSIFPELERLTLYGFCEPFINPNLFAMLKLAREYLPDDSRVMLSTNGSVIGPRTSDKLLNGGLLDELSFSIDTTDMDRLGRIRRGSEPKTILENLEYLTKARTRFGR